MEPTLPNAHATLAEVDAIDGRWNEAREGFERASELGGRWTGNNTRYGMWLGNYSEVIANVERNISLDPSSPGTRGTLVLAYWYSRNLESAVATAERGTELFPDFVPTRGMLGVLESIRVMTLKRLSSCDWPTLFLMLDV